LRVNRAAGIVVRALDRVPSHMSRSSFLILLGAVAALLASSPGTSRAQAGLYFEEVAPKAVRVDGSLREWPRASFRDLGRGRDGAMRYALGYDASGIYVAADVSDGDVLRRPRPTDADDGVGLTLKHADRRGVPAFP